MRININNLIKSNNKVENSIEEPKIEDIVLDTLIIECKDNEWYS